MRTNEGLPALVYNAANSLLREATKRAGHIEYNHGGAEASSALSLVVTVDLGEMLNISQ